MSVDAFWLLPDKPRATAEVARVLRPGGRFVFTTWDADSTPPRCPPQVPDHRPLLREAGFSVASYQQTPDWQRRQLAVYDRLRASADELAAELGADVANDLITEARTFPDWLTHAQRVLILATLD
jgi:SAM-dependent methyltransferase